MASVVLTGALAGCAAVPTPPPPLPSDFYPDASHAFILLGPPSQRLDYAHRVVDWVERYTLHNGRPRLEIAHWQRRLERLAEPAPAGFTDSYRTYCGT